MANDEAIHLGLSSVTLLSASFIICAALMQDRKLLRTLQLCVCSTTERGVVPEDSRMLSKVVNKATSGDSIQWSIFFDDSIVPPPQ